MSHATTPDVPSDPARPPEVRVWFVGAGPGDPELITVKGRNLLARADLVLYAGSLVPVEVALAAGPRPEARLVDSAPLTLEQTHALLMDTVAAGGLAVRLHTGDPSLYGAIAEQMRLLEAAGVAYAMVPGVTAAFAAAAAANISFTVPGQVQALALTRLGGRTPVPAGQSPGELARGGAAVAVYLSGGHWVELARELAGAGLAADTAVLVAHRVGHPSEKLVRMSLAELAAADNDPRLAGLERQSVVLVLPGERAGGGSSSAPARSRLYDPGFGHGCRPASEPGSGPGSEPGK